MHDIDTSSQSLAQWETEQAQALADEFNLTLKQAKLFLCLQDNDSQSYAEIAFSLQTSPQAVSRMSQALTRLDLARVDVHGEREYSLWLTRKGRDRLQQVPKWEEPK